MMLPTMLLVIEWNFCVWNEQLDILAGEGSCLFLHWKWNDKEYTFFKGKGTDSYQSDNVASPYISI